TGPSDISTRWRVTPKHVWVSMSLVISTGSRSVNDILARYERTEWDRGKLFSQPEEEAFALGPHFMRETPAREIRLMCWLASFRLNVQYDYLPVDDTTVLMFMLRNVEGNLRPAGKTGDIVGFTVNPDDARFQKPK